MKASNYGDQAVAAAIAAAHTKLIKGGWNFTSADIGIHAKVILDAVYHSPESKNESK